MRKQIDCKCGKSFVAIDPDSTVYTCGVVGLVEFRDVHVFGGVVTCAHCQSQIYKEPKK